MNDVMQLANSAFSIWSGILFHISRNLITYASHIVAQRTYVSVEFDLLISRYTLNSFRHFTRINFLDSAKLLIRRRPKLDSSNLGEYAMQPRQSRRPAPP